MNQLRVVSVVILTCLISFSYGQSVPFLNYFSDARTAGMGNAGFVVASPFASQRNVAAIMSSTAQNTEVAVSLLSWQPQFSGSSVINASGYTKHKNVGIAAGIRYNILDAIERTDDQGSVIGPYTPMEYAAEVGFGYKINSAISVGATLRYISSDLGGEEKASALASDISILYEYQKLNVGLGYSNVGTKINYGNSAYSLPARIHSGAAYRFLDKKEHNLIGVADVSYQLTPNYKGVLAGFGAEYTYNKLVSLRTGYRFESELVGMPYGTIGCGLHLFGLTLDFAYVLAAKNDPTRQTMLVSLKWGK